LIRKRTFPTSSDYLKRILLNDLKVIKPMNAAEILEKHVGHRFHFIMDHTTMNAMKEYAGKFAEWAGNRYTREGDKWLQQPAGWPWPGPDVYKTTEELLTEFENS
jgi:hypothetical protein